MDEDDERNALRQVLKERCPGVIFRDDDINKLVDEGFTTAVALAAATKDDLDVVLSGQRGVVAVLLKAFVQPAEGEAISKKPKTSPVEHLDSKALLVVQCRYMRDLLASPNELHIAVVDLHEFLARKSRPLPLLEPAMVHSVSDPQLVKLYIPAMIQNNEADNSHILRCLTGDFLELLNSSAPAKGRLVGLEASMDSAENPGSAAVLALVPLMRPDYMLYLRNILILRWENKRDLADFAIAMDENTEKLKAWSPLYYYELPYVIGGCGAGRIF